MPHSTTPREPTYNGITISTFLDAGSPFSSKNLGRRRPSIRRQQYPTDSSRLLQVDDLETPNLLSPEDVSSDFGRTSRRSFFNNLNPFSSSSSRRSSVSSSSRASSRDSRHQETDGDRTGIFRSPLMNPSPPTRRPRAQSPPPAYSENPSAASGPTLGTPPTYSQNEASTSASTSTTSKGRSQGSNSTSASSSHCGIQGRDDDDFKFLETFDTEFLIDDSASMYGRRWREVGEALVSVVPVCTKHDSDGVGVWFLNKKERRNEYRNVTRAREDEPGTGVSVQGLFQQRRPDGDATLTGTRLREILNRYVRRCERIEAENERRAEQGLDPLDLPKPINIIVITDGQASDDPESVLREMAGRLDAIRAPPYQVGVQFFQVGNDERATLALKQLDDKLGVTGGLSSVRKPVRDMVDTVTFDTVGDGRTGTPRLTRDGILKTVLGAVNRRHDNSNLASRP